MSFLERFGDPNVLTEALAFIDAFELSSGEQDLGETSGSSEGAADESSSDTKKHEGGAPDKYERSRTKRKNALYSARLRAKKKNEMSALKEEVQRLEMQLQRLQKGQVLSDQARRLTSKELQLQDWRRSSSRWLAEASDQALKRQKSEQLNVQLKTLLTKLLKTSKTLQSSVKNLCELRSEIGLVIGPPSNVVVGPSLRSNDATPQLGELRGYLDQMYTDTQDVLAPQLAASSAAFQLQMKRDPLYGALVGQLCSSTPVGCDLDVASRMVWDGMQLKGGLCCKEFVHRLHVNGNAVAKSYFLSVSGQSQATMLHGVSLVRKFEERDRILYLWASAIVPPGGSQRTVRFREKGWAMLSRAPNNPDQESIFQTSYEVFPERVHGDGEQFYGDSTAKRDYEQLCCGVVDVLTSSLRLFHEDVQSTLLEEAPATNYQLMSV
ncbi:hypothetical protein PHYBOEH_003201 [Phytophthora boehmeriae]|uniref:BZIP domain-containing protein n=1 Tax=Phytophthora boehmeriae TaxID=109152 RepID=A0A8T1WQP1_9STRA|nr:hypothetical protein PHYBOEH_003201 [Phytophthora boehmeriae]